MRGESYYSLRQLVDYHREHPLPGGGRLSYVCTYGHLFLQQIPSLKLNEHNLLVNSVSAVELEKFAFQLEKITSQNCPMLNSMDYVQLVQWFGSGFGGSSL